MLGQGNDSVQFEELLDDDGDVVADLVGIEDGLNVIVVLVAIADDRQLFAGGKGNRRHQLRLRTDLEADVVFLAELGDRLDHLALLVDLDREKGLVAGRVFIFFDGVVEGPVDRVNPAFQNVHEAQQDRRFDLAFDQVVH